MLVLVIIFMTMKGQGLDPLTPLISKTSIEWKVMGSSVYVAFTRIKLETKFIKKTVASR